MFNYGGFQSFAVSVSGTSSLDFASCENFTNLFDLFTLNYDEQRCSMLQTEKLANTTQYRKQALLLSRDDWLGAARFLLQFDSLASSQSICESSYKLAA